MLVNSRLGELTYCTQVHQAESWEQLLKALQSHVPRVKRSLSPNASFGLGLQLPANLARSLEAPGNLGRFKAWLRSEDLYVFTINGVAYGRHSRKAQRYGVDWRSELRLQYSNQLAKLLAQLLPDQHPEGTVNTVAGGYRADLTEPGSEEAMRDRLVRHAAYLYRLEESAGQSIALALEPAPDCYLTNVANTIRFFHEVLFADRSIVQFASLTGATRGFSASLLRRHLGVSLDAAHAAVEFEDVATLLDMLQQADIPIKKLQLSSALRVPEVNAHHFTQLRRFTTRDHLHQVVSRNPRGICRYFDVDEALGNFAMQLRKGPTLPAEWRIHHHLPIFLERVPPFETTQPFLHDLLLAQRQKPFTRQLEVDTYPPVALPMYPGQPVLPDAIVRELRWARDILCAP